MMSWSLGDPVGAEGWGTSQLALVRRLLPHVRQFVRVRQALVRAQALETTVTTLLENRRIGVVHLDRRGRILAANDRARQLLHHGDGLADRDGVLCTRAPDDQPRLDRLVAAALPSSATVAVSGSMPIRRSSLMPPLVVHVKPVRGPHPDYGVRHVAALVLLIEPGRRQRIDPGLIAATLGLTPGESQVAVVVGGRPECRRYGPGHRAHQRCHLLAPEANLPKTPPLPAGGLGAARAVGRRVGLTTARPAAGAGRFELAAYHYWK